MTILPRATYRTKMLLAMMFVVTAVSVATLVVAQQRVQRNYERMFRRQFQREIAYFKALQETRLAAVKDQCLRLSRSIRLVARLNEPDLDPADLYQIAEGELREVLQSSPPSGQPGSERLQAAFFRFLDATGRVLGPPVSAGETMRVGMEQPLRLAHQVLAAAQPQQVGYLALSPETTARGSETPGLQLASSTAADAPAGGPSALHEVVVTKVLDPATGAMAGALVLGFRVPDLVPKHAGLMAGTGTPESGLMPWGILLEGQLFAGPRVISKALGTLVADKVSQHLRSSAQAQTEFNVSIEGEEPYRAFCELLSNGTTFPPAYQVCLYSLEEARREQRSLRWRIIALGAGGLVAALGLSLFISHGLSAPIRALVAGTAEIQRGNYQVRVPVGSADELGQLAASFNDMAEGLALKEKYRTVLNMVADEKIAQRLIDGGLMLGGELREVTVLFCDIRGFTALTQNMAPGDIIDMLNEHMTALMRVVKVHHGVLDKFVGDLLMAIFGAPLRHGDDPRHAAQCALGLIEERETLNRTSRHRLQVGIGLSSGTVVAGCMGSHDRLNYTVLGERVNLASRLCGRAGPGEILLDEATCHALGDSARVLPIGEVELKGFAAPVRVFRLEAMVQPKSQPHL